MKDTSTSDAALLLDSLHVLQSADFDTGVWTVVDGARIGAAALRLASAALADSVAVAAVHPLGFLRVPLTDWRLDQGRAAVHVWDRQSSVSGFDGDVHDHCYDFVSLCLMGGLRHSIYDVAADHDAGERVAPLHYDAGSCNAAGTTLQQPAAVVKRQAFLVEAPAIYGLRHDVLHVAEPLSDVTVSVQFQSPCKKPQARVFRRRVNAGARLVAPLTLSAARAADLLRRAAHDG